jgi:hypothetical protein
MMPNPAKNLSSVMAYSSSEENDVAEDVVGQIYDPDKNQLPYGGAVDMNGRIVWVVTEEEDKVTRERIRKAFGKK